MEPEPEPEPETIEYDVNTKISCGYISNQRK